MAPTKENAQEIVDQFEQYHLQFRAEFSSRLTEIRRALLNISPAALNDEPKSNGKTVVRNEEGNVNAKKLKATNVKNKFADRANTVKSKPITTNLPDLMDDTDDKSAVSKNVKSKTFISPTIKVARKTFETNVARRKTAAIAPTVAAKRDFSDIKSALARQILKRRQSTCDVPRPDPFPTGARATAITKRRISHAVSQSSKSPDQGVLPAQLSVKSERESTSPVSSIKEAESDFHFGYDNDEEQRSTPSNDPHESEQQISSVGNVSEVAKLVHAALLKQKMERITQTVKPMNYDDENPTNDQPGDQF